MRKFLKKIFCSHGTPLGYLGSLSQKGPPEIFLKWVLFNLSNPLRHPAPLVDPLLTKNLDTAGPWCGGPRPPTAFFSTFEANKHSSNNLRYECKSLKNKDKEIFQKIINVRMSKKLFWSRLRVPSA